MEKKKYLTDCYLIFSLLQSNTVVNRFWSWKRNEIKIDVCIYKKKYLCMPAVD